MLKNILDFASELQRFFKLKFEAKLINLRFQKQN